MKSVIVGLAVLLSMSFFRPDNQRLPCEACVEQHNGCYMFVESQPVRKYTVLGEVWATIPQRDYTMVRNNVMKRARKFYPDCDAVILDVSNQTGKAIKFE